MFFNNLAFLPCLAFFDMVWLFFSKYDRLGARENWKLVRWCRTQASGHSSQSVVDGRVNKAGVSTAAPDRSAVLCSRMDQGSGSCSQRCCSNNPLSLSQQAASGVRRVTSASCEVTRGVGDTWAICPTLLRGIWVRSKRPGFRCWNRHWAQ